MLTAHDINEGKALHVAVFQVLDLFTKQHRRRCTVTKEQRKAAVRFSFQRRLDQRQNGSNAAAYRKCHIVAGMLCRKINGEMPVGRHHIERSSADQMFVGTRSEEHTSELQSL